ncbi:MAG: hypothetical protein ACP6KW_07915 [Candidatus Thorarchaeota archaeon]
MMDDHDHSELPSYSTSPLRWLLLAIVAILGTIGIVGVGMHYSVDVASLLLVFYVPLFVFLLWAIYRWAQGREVAVTDEAEDRSVFTLIQKRALPVRFISHLNILQCPDCEHRFDLVNARPVEDEIDVILCPNCGVRLYVPGM